MFRFAGSVALRGGRGAADKCHWPVWGALVGFRPHWVCRTHRCVCFPCLHCSGSRLLSRGWALYCTDFPGLCNSDSSFWVFHKSTDLVEPAFSAFPGQSSSGSQELDKHTLPGCGAPYPLRGPSLSFRACRSGPPCVCSGELDSS